MNTTEIFSLQCPYCGERIDVIVDCSLIPADYIEDCSVCCSPMRIHVLIDDAGEMEVIAFHQND